MAANPVTTPFAAPEIEAAARPLSHNSMLSHFFKGNLQWIFRFVGLQNSDNHS